MSVMRGQCDARPTVTFPAARHHRPLAGTKLYCLVTEAHVCCPGLHSTAERPGFESTTCWLQVQHPNHSSSEPHKWGAFVQMRRLTKCALHRYFAMKYYSSCDDNGEDFYSASWPNRQLYVLKVAALWIFITCDTVGYRVYINDRPEALVSCQLNTAVLTDLLPDSEYRSGRSHYYFAFNFQHSFLLVFLFTFIYDI